MLGATLPPLGALVPPWVAGVLDVPDGTDPESHLMRCLAAFQSRPPTWLRLQRRFAAETLADLQRSDPARVPHPRMPEAVAVPQTAGLPDQLARVKGRVAVQDLASQAVGLVCDPRPGSRWWDVCAGAGGKALHLADLMDDEGTVLATDIRESALAELDRRARAAGLRCLHRRPWDALTDPLPDTGFDGVLVDAPCSGLGTWHRNPDARWRTAQEDVARQAAAQEALLERVADAVRPGGALLYATCTLTRPENNGVVAAFLARRSDFRPAELRSPLTGAPSHGALWIWPWEGPCNGTFVARLKRQSDARAPTA
jgi:16S rRNA (cytosine967-C5)-methyltransferase